MGKILVEMPAVGTQQAPSGHETEAGLRSVAGELVTLVVGQARRIPLQRYLTSVLMTALLLVYIPPLWPLIWGGVVLMAVFLRTRITLALPQDAHRSDEQKLRLLGWLFWLTGIVQAMVLVFFPEVPVLIGAVITIYLIGITSATLHATAGFSRICVPYIAIMMLPVAAAWTLTPMVHATAVERFIFAGLALLYSTTLLSHARGLYAVFLESYNIRLQRLELNRRLREALDKAETANQSKTRFLASASHDLRQPIHALSLFSGSLLMRPMDERTGAIARQLDQGVKSLASQLDALLDISRLDAGVIQRSIVTIDLCVLLRQIRNEFEPQAQEKGLHLVLHCDPDVFVRTDQMLLQRIVRNLVSNAIKYTEAGEVELFAERVGEMARIRISDTGPGIPESEQGRVFEEFYQLQNPERDRSKGLGLGLAIVSRLTKLLDVPMQMQSTPGVGTTFTVDLNAVSSPVQPVPAVAEPAPEPGDRIQVLVVDDEEAIRVGMCTLLEEMGFGVRAVPSTAAAVETARRFRPAVLLADFRLRGDDSGMRTISALRERWPQLPALLISGDTAPDRIREAHDAGIKLLHKPVSAELLRDSILKAAQ